MIGKKLIFAKSFFIETLDFVFLNNNLLAITKRLKMGIEQELSRLSESHFWASQATTKMDLLLNKIREKIHLSLIKKTPSPLGKALVTLTTETSKENCDNICIDDLKYRIDDTVEDKVIFEVTF